MQTQCLMAANPHTKPTDLQAANIYTDRRHLLSNVVSYAQ